MKFFLILFSVAALAIQGHSAGLDTTTAEEYCFFLNTCPDAASSSDYFDSQFMCSTQIDGGSVPALLINENPKLCIVSHNEYHFRYTVVPGRENQVIDVNSLSSHAKNNFLAWRKNPTAQELCDDINDQLEGAYGLAQSGVASTIKGNYPDVSKWIFNNIDPIAVAVFNGENYLHKEVRDGSHTCLTFSNAEDDPLLPAGLPLHAVVVPGMKYYRPSALIVDDIPPVPAPVVHVGTKSAYPILDPGNLPVPLEEYVAYLNKMGADDFLYPWQEHFFLEWFFNPCFSAHYDTNLMDPKSSEYCVVRSGVSGCYSYAVKEGCDNFVVDALTSDWAYHDFSYWTSRPTVQEICDYINDQSEDFYLRQVLDENFSGVDRPTVFGEEAVVIKNCYSNSPNASDMFRPANDIVQGEIKKMPVFWPKWELVDEDGNTIAVSNQDQESAQFPGLVQPLIVEPRFKYHRPSTIQVAQ
ncbi:MAG: hypothetical protein K2W97_06690 [Chthoniobacterales bacterium]|nr:hypothetical protein [Chthoniobacterales bacterium]